MSFFTLNVTLFAVFATAILALSLFPPAVPGTPPSSHTISAKKVLILTSILSGYVTIDEGADNIMAVSKQARDWGTYGLMSSIYPLLEHITVIGSTTIPDPEQVLYLQPDTVFAAEGQAAVLKMLGLPGLFQVRFDSSKPVQSRLKTWKMIGQATGKSARSATLSDTYATKLVALQSQVPLDTAHHKRVVYLLAGNGTWSLANSNNYLAYKPELIGAINSGKGFKFNDKSDLEQLLLLDPDVILFVANPGDPTTMKEILGRPEFQTLRAVREHRIYKLPAHTYMNEPVEDPLLLMWMAEVFYPDVMPAKLRDEYKETYQEVYHYSISDDEIDKAIYLEENRNSAGYDRFIRQKNCP